MRLFLMAVFVACGIASAASAGPPGSVSFGLSGETRVRYEALEGQFRANGEGGDQLLLLRSLLHGTAQIGPLTLGLELQDSRTYLEDNGTPLSSSIVNPLDVLQAYANWDDLPGALGSGSQSRLTLGRQTISIGSKRQIERVDFANVIKSYTGVHWIHENEEGDALHLVYAVPVARFPAGRAALDDDRLEGDEEQWERRIWAVHYRRADMAPGRVPGLNGELFVYGLDENDTGAHPTPDRSYVAPGIRLHRPARPGSWDIDLEASWRHGSRFASSSPDDTRLLRVDATMLFASLGVTFEHPWKPRAALEYYYASGDEDPDDDRFDQHERLFGARRGDLNNTSIFGPLTPANISAPGFRLEIAPNDRLDARVYYHAAYLASKTDSWVIARRRDQTGASGRFIGHVVDSRARYWLNKNRLRLEVGASALFYGEFARNAPRPPDSDRSVFGYVQLTQQF